MINKEVKKLYDELINPTEALSKDEFLEKLIKIRDITKYNIYHELLSYTNKNELKELIRGYSNEDAGKQIDIKENLERESLNRLIGEKISILEIFEKYKDCIKKVFSENTSLDEKLSSLKVTYDYIDGVIFPPEGDTRIQPGSGKGLNKKEGYDRISLLFNDVLNIENNIYLGDFRVVIGKDDNNSLRKYSYIVIEIPKLNKTIFVNNKYGETTYIYDGIPTDKNLLTKGKESLKDSCTRISFHDAEQWKTQVLNNLFKEESKNKDGAYKNIKAKDLKNVLNLEEKREFIRNELNKKEVKDLRFSLNATQRRDFKLNDLTNYTSIARVFDFMGHPHEICKDKIFIELSKKIFGENDPNVINLINTHAEHTIDSIRALFKNDNQLKKQRFSITTYKRNKFKLSDGTTYVNIARIFGFNNKSEDLPKDKIFIELSKKIFGENDPDIINYIDNHIEHNIDSIRALFSKSKLLKIQRFSLTAQKRQKFKLPDGTSYIIIARIFGFDGVGFDSFKDKFFIKLSKRIFGENDPDVINLINNYVVHTVNSIKSLFSNDKILKKKRFSLNGKQRKEFKLKDGTSYSDILKIFDIKGNKEDKFKYGAFIELSKRIFGENDPDVINLINTHVEHTVDSIRALFKNDNQLKKQRFSIASYKRNKFKLPDGTSYIIIARIFGILANTKDLYIDEIFIELSKRIFGENDPDIINYIDNHIEHNTDFIRTIFKNNPQLKKDWITTIASKRGYFKLPDGTSYIIIARIFGLSGKSHILFKDETFIELNKRIFGENDPDVINLINNKIIHTINSIKNIFLNDKQLKEKWISMTGHQRREFKLDDGTSYSNIARIFGIKEKDGEIFKDKPFIELSKKIFGENDPDVINLINTHVKHTVDSIRALFKNNNQLKKQRFSLNFTQKIKFKLSDGTTYVNIARIFGFNNKSEDLPKDKIFIELSKKIFGENDPDMINYINNHIEFNIDSVRALFLNDEPLKKKRFSLNYDTRPRFKLKECLGYISIARIFKLDMKKHLLTKDENFLELSKRIFGEDDPSVIKLSEKLSKK